MGTTRRKLSMVILAGALSGASAMQAMPAVSGGPLPSADSRLDELEKGLVRDPGDLRIGSEYRQLVIATGRYDRSIKLFERLARDPRGGANRFVNLALAYVDKVPVSGSIRQALLGRDAIDAASRAIAIEPSAVAYFIRGLVSLYFDRAIFHRVDKGVADLEEARRLAALQPNLPVLRVFIALGDGYWRLGRPQKAREIWRDGANRYPASESLRRRVNATDEQADAVVGRALDAHVRVDTTLRELFPDLTFDPAGSLR